MYINVDNNYNANVLSDSRKWNVYRIAQFNNGSWGSVGGAPTYLKSFTLTDYASDGSNITMGCVCGSKIVISFKNAPTTLANELTEGKQIMLYLSLRGNANQPSSSQLYTVPYVIDEAKVVPIMSGRNITVTAYDLSYLMTHEYVTALTNPTALEIVTEIANKYNLSVDSSVTAKIKELDLSLLNMTFTPLSGFTCKETLGYIAGCFGCNVRVGSGRKIYFEWFEESSMPDVNNNVVYMGGATLSEKHIIKMIETGTSENPIVYPDNANGNSINFENPYITRDLARLIYEKKLANNKVSFTVGKVKYKGNPINMSGKIVSVVSTQNVSTPFYIMKRSLTYNGGLSETIECLGESETTINYKVTSPTQQKIDRALSKMENAIKNATDIITQTKGSVFEVIPVDENDPSKGNSGWKLYTTDPAKNNLILANSSGIGFSSNGGESFDAAAIYIDENGRGHINANYINVGELDGSLIKAGTIVVGKDNVSGLNDELADLLDTANTAKSIANNAKSLADDASEDASSAITTATTANNNATSALSVANSANGVIANWCYNNNTTYIDGANIFTGTITAEQISANAITADKLNVGVAKRQNIMPNPEFDIRKTDGSLEGWVALNGKITPQDNGWFTFLPNSTGYSGFFRTVWLKPGRYALIARVNPYNLESASSEAGVCCMVDRSYVWFEDEQILGNQWYVNQSQDVTYKQVFDYTGNEGYANVGFCFYGLKIKSSTSYMAVTWCALYEAPNEATGFYASEKSLLSTDYKVSNYIQNTSSYIDSIPYDKAMGVDSQNGLTVVGGRVGSFLFTEDGLNVETHVPIEDTEEGYNTYLKINTQPAFSGNANISSFLDYPRQFYTNIELGGNTGSTKNPDQVLMLCPEHVYCGDKSENEYSVMTSNLIKTSEVRATSVNATEVVADTVKASNLPTKIQWGVEKNVTTGSPISLSGFQSTPTVICTPLQTIAANTVGLTALVSSLSKTSFTVRMNVASGDWTYGTDVMWIALGE